MFYGHIYTTVTVHSIKDCRDPPRNVVDETIVAVRVG